MTKTARARIVTPASINKSPDARGLRFLAKRDPDLARILRELGAPPPWVREPGFPTLLLIILEQKTSLASARAVYERLLALASPLSPERFLALDDETLKSIGFSRQKADYGRHLASAIVKGELDLRALDTLDDEAARAALVKIKGIGNWTADIYLLSVLGRPDVWPGGDLALAVAVQDVKRLSARPNITELDEISVAWRPWRALAARLLWHYYLHKRGQTVVVAGDDRPRRNLKALE